MSLSDHDLELLDRYLDGDLSDAEAVGLEARLGADAALSAELSRLRDHRAARCDAFASMEATDLEAQQLQWYIRGAIHQAAGRGAGAPVGGDARVATVERWRAALGGLSKVAAVLLVGFVVGYGYRAADRSPASPGVAVQPGLTNPAVGGGRIAAGSPGADVVQPVSFPTDPVAGGDGYVVSLKDQFGNVIATKQFRTLQEARDFAGDVERWQQRYRQVQKNGVRFIGDDF